MKTLHVGDNTHTLQEVADKLGVTRERARQIEAQAIKRLKHPKLRKQWEEIIDTLRGMSYLPIILSNSKPIQKLSFYHPT